MPRKERSDKGGSRRGYTPGKKAARKQKFTERAQEEGSRRSRARKAHGGKYTPANIEKAATKPREQLTKYQRKAVGMLPREPVTPGDIARSTGIPLQQIMKRIESHSWDPIDTRTLEYRPGQGYYAKTASGREVVFHGVRNIDTPDEKFESINDNSEDIRIQFATKEQVEEAIDTRSPYCSPPCTASGADTEIVVFLKDGAYRSNIA